jgi:hypothetical protein
MKSRGRSEGSQLEARFGMRAVPVVNLSLSYRSEKGA